MTDDWNRFVTVRFPDGRERKVPLAQWNEGLKSRILDASGTFELPKDPNAPAPIKTYFMESPQGKDGDEETPSGAKELLLDLDLEGMTDWERDFIKSVTKQFQPWSVAQLDCAMTIIRKYRNRE